MNVLNRNCIKNIIYSLIINWHLAMYHGERFFKQVNNHFIIVPVGHPTAVVNVLAFSGTCFVCALRIEWYTITDIFYEIKIPRKKLILYTKR